MDTILNDLKYAWRGLRRTPSFTLLAVCSLALAMGANTAIFSLLDTLMLRRLSVQEPERLVTLEQVLPDGSRLYNLALPDAERFAQIPNVFSHVSATTWADAYNVAAGANVDERLARVSVVTGSFFETLGVRAAAGRVLGPEDDRVEGGHPVAVISDAYWRRRFDRDPSAIGRTLALRGTTYEIVGVAAPGFSGDWVGWPTDFWVPIAMAQQIFGESAPGAPRGLRRQYKVLARLAPDVALTEASRAADLVYRDLQQNPPPASGISRTARLDVVSAATGYSRQREAFAQPLTAVMIAVGAVLLIACANVASLFLSRAMGRQREIAVRTAVGASRARIVRQVVVEGFVVSAIASAVGFVIALWQTSLLADLARSGPVGAVNFGAQLVDLDVTLDGRTLAFTVTLCAAATLLFSLAPALKASGRIPIRSLGGRGTIGGDDRGPFALRKILVVVQLALSLALLVGMGVYLRSLSNLKMQDFGFARDRLVLAWTLPSATGREGAALTTFWTDVQTRIGALPGVVSASPSAEGILSGAPTGGPLVRVEGAPPADATRADATMTVGPEFFATVRQPLLRGRDFSTHDTASSRPVTIISEGAARQFFGTEDPIGRRLVLGTGTGPSLEVIGVVGDVTHNTPRARSQRMIYYPWTQNARRLRWMCLAIRTSGEPAAVMARVRQELRAIDPMLPIMKIDTFGEQLDDALFQERLVTSVSVAFGVLAALLAAGGLFAMLSYTVARRTNEIGVRVVLGATRGAVLRLVAREVLPVLAAGTGAGLILTVFAAKQIASGLFGVSAMDPLTVSAAVAAIGIVTIIAAAIPARRASNVDPMVALRAE
jgi:predicted permease